MTGRWFSPGTAVTSTNKTDHHDITEICLKVALNTITIDENVHVRLSDDVKMQIYPLISHFSIIIINDKIYEEENLSFIDI